MWLLGVILDNICGFFKVCFSRTLSKQIYRNCAVLMTGTVVVAVLVFTAGSFTGGGKNQVYAVKASRNAEEAGEGEDVKEEELQAGLMGIVASVNNLEAYSQAADGVDLETANQEILAGTSRIRKNALYQKYVEECAKNIGSIGYYAQQKVLENQMDGNDYYTLLQIVEAEATCRAQSCKGFQISRYDLRCCLADGGRFAAVFPYRRRQDLYGLDHG